MSWARKQQFKYSMYILGFFFVIILLFTYPMIFKKATCFDGKQNGQETGIDCGGSCSVICSNEVYTPIVVWSRGFQVTNNIYNLVALVENQNKNAATQEISYEFRAYNQDNIFIGRREGSTFLPANQQFLIFEPKFDGIENEVKSVSFEFKPGNIWINKPPVTQTFPVFIRDIVVSDYETNPVLKARITNESIHDFPEFDVVTVLYDEQRNAINVSRTYKEGLKSNESSDVFFSWTQPFNSEPVLKEVWMQLDPFSVSF